MKKKNLVLCFVSFMMMLFVLSGCNKKKEVSKTKENTGNIIETTMEATTEEVVPEAEGMEDFMIFGVDTRAKNLGKGTRSDSMMVVHVDHNEKKVRIASIYRDTMVHIEGHGFEKITHAHSYGGPDLAVATCNENFDLNVENYMTVNFINVADLVDSMGGIEQDLDESEVKYINGYIKEINSIRKTNSDNITSPGTYVLDGTQAVAFTRIRYTAGGDYKRAERQRTILFKIFEAAKELNTFDRISLAEKMMDQISTSYSSDEITNLLYYLSQYEIDGMNAYPKVFYGGKVGNAWVEVPITLIDMTTSMHQFLYNDENYIASDRVEEYSDYLYNVESTPNEDLRSDEEK